MTGRAQSPLGVMDTDCVAATSHISDSPAGTPMTPCPHRRADLTDIWRPSAPALTLV
jgi:hypothetical protein